MCIIWTCVGSYIPIKQAQAADTNVKGYTVTTNGEADWAHTNSTASNGPITLSYKVGSATAASVSNNGVIATAAPKETYPYNGTNGSMRYRNMENNLMVEGRNYTITLAAMKKCRLAVSMVHIVMGIIIM